MWWFTCLLVLSLFAAPFIILSLSVVVEKSREHELRKLRIESQRDHNTKLLATAKLLVNILLPSNSPNGPTVRPVPQHELSEMVNLFNLSQAVSNPQQTHNGNQSGEYVESADDLHTTTPQECDNIQQEDPPNNLNRSYEEKKEKVDNLTTI